MNLAKVDSKKANRYRIHDTNVEMNAVGTCIRVLIGGYFADDNCEGKN